MYFMDGDSTGGWIDRQMDGWTDRGRGRLMNECVDGWVGDGWVGGWVET